MKKAFALLLLVGFVWIGCTKEKEAAVPTCIQDRLKTFDQLEACSQGASLQRYNFQSNSVYVFNHGFCNSIDSSEVRDAECNLLGYLGGVLNNDTINGLNFYISAKYEAVIWQN